MNQFKLFSDIGTAVSKFVGNSEGTDASILDTYANALFDSGKTAEAIEY